MTLASLMVYVVYDFIPSAQLMGYVVYHNWLRFAQICSLRELIRQKAEIWKNIFLQFENLNKVDSTDYNLNQLNNEFGQFVNQILYFLSRTFHGKIGVN